MYPKYLQNDQIKLSNGHNLELPCKKSQQWKAWDEHVCGIIWFTMFIDVRRRGTLWAVPFPAWAGDPGLYKGGGGKVSTSKQGLIHCSQFLSVEEGWFSDEDFCCLAFPKW